MVKTSGMMVEVDERRADENADEHHAAPGLVRREQPPALEKQQRGQQLDEGVTEAEGPAAAARAAAQQKPGQDRDVVVPGDGRAARAVGAGPHDGFFRGHAVDDDVEKAADGGADDEGHGGEKPRQRSGDIGEFGGRNHLCISSFERGKVKCARGR